ncbi:MAG: ABC transporter permease [Planctomycetota bacterium]|nr:MAG: ABC transporter permease [Planctomycetota bacterium]
MQLWALIVDAFRESLDRKIFWVMAAISVLIALTILSVGIESDRVTLLFGTWEIETKHFDPLSGLGQRRLMALIVFVLLDLFLGWTGMILMIIATAGMFPSMMERGRIDVLLSKPLGRPRLFLYKYIAGMVFVFVQASIFVGLTFLVIGFHWGLWVPGYLAAIPLLVLLFSYLYCVSVLVAVRTRSASAAVLLTIAAWVLFSVPTSVRQTFESFPKLKEHERLYRIVKVASWIPPKTSDITYFAARWAKAGTSLDIVPEEVMAGDDVDRSELDRARNLEEKEKRKSPWLSIGSSLLFEGCILLWGMAIFCRQDY